MNATTLSLAFKEQTACDEEDRTSKEQCENDGEDRLSSLPNSVIHHILSFLPTKHAVATSILSRKWKQMWTSLPKLEFDEGLVIDPADKMKFANFIDRALNLHDETDIKKFRITCENHEESRVEAWICAALQHKVQDLSLNIYGDKPSCLFLPKLLCESEYITVLKLQSNHRMVIPNSFSLPNLKILHLRAIIYSAKNKPLFSNCPVLTVLILDECLLVDFDTIVLSIPTVKSLSLYEIYRESEMKIYAKSLLSFLYSGGMPSELSLYNTSSIFDAYVDVHANDAPNKIIGTRASKLLRQLSNVSHLAVNNVTISTLVLDRDLYDNLPTFHKLVHLELGTEVPLLDFKATVALILNSPNVQHLLFEKDIFPRGCIDIFRAIEPARAEEMLSCLKLVEFKNFSANQIELILIKRLLEYAKTLERIVIQSSKELLEDGEKQMKVQEQISAFPNCSKCYFVDDS